MTLTDAATIVMRVAGASLPVNGGIEGGGPGDGEPREWLLLNFVDVSRRQVVVQPARRSRRPVTSSRRIPTPSRKRRGRRGDHGGWLRVCGGYPRPIVKEPARAPPGATWSPAPGPK